MRRFCWRLVCCFWVGRIARRRFRSYAGCAVAVHTFPDFLKFLIPALNGTVGFWATVSLNIPDFSRFARNQREQVIGQALALPTTMTLYSLIGIPVTSATVVIYGTAIWDPVQLLSRFHSPVAVVISLIAILLATLNVNIGANVVSPANDFSNLWPRKISFRDRRNDHVLHGNRDDAVEAARDTKPLSSDGWAGMRHFWDRSPAS